MNHGDYLRKKRKLNEQKADAIVPASLSLISFAVGLLGSIGCAAGAMLAPQDFWFSYLAAFLFWLGPVLGCIVLLLLHGVTGGNWGLVIRHVAQSVAGALPLLALFAIPLGLAVRFLYPWANPEIVASDELLRHKEPYLNLPFFLIRGVIFFVIWLILAAIVRRQGRRSNNQDTGERTGLYAIGLIFYGLTITFASIDWIMSLEPHWMSTIFGIMIAIGQILSGLATVVLILASFVRAEDHHHHDHAGEESREKQHDLGERPLLAAGHFADLGSLMMAFVMLWAYMSFSQYILIYAADLPEETPWYLRRLTGGWQYVVPLLIGLGFVFPFLLLVNKPLKRNPRYLVWIAALVLLMRFVDLNWLVLPVNGGLTLSAVLWSLVSIAGIGGWWVGLVVTLLRRRSLLSPEAAVLEASHHG